MQDRNECFLEGTVGRDLESKRTSDGRIYVSFTLKTREANMSYTTTASRNHGDSYLRVFVYDKRNIDYLVEMGLKPQDRVSIFGQLHPWSLQVGSRSVSSVIIVVRDISVIKKKQ